MKLKKIKLYRPIMMASNNRESIGDDVCKMVLHKDLIWTKDKNNVIRIIPLTNIEHMIPEGDGPKGLFDE